MIKFSINDIIFTGKYDDLYDSLIYAFSDDVITDDEFDNLLQHADNEEDISITRDGRGAKISISSDAMEWLEENATIIEGGDVD